MDVHGRTRRKISGAHLPVITLVDGAFDAGSAVGMMREAVREGLKVTPLAEFDADLLIDHRARRPRIVFKSGEFTDYRPPRLGVEVVTDELGNQALLLSGAEPVIGWERVAIAVTDLLDSVGAKDASVVHAMPLPVPHTRPVAIRQHGDPGGLEAGPFDMPASFSHLLEERLKEAGHEVTGMTIQVPHYIADSDYPPAAVAGLDAMAAQAGISVPSEDLRELGRAVDAQIATQVEQNPEAASLVANLEQRYDVETPQLRSSAALAHSEAELPDGDQIAAAAEKFLSNVVEGGVVDAQTADEIPAKEDEPDAPDSGGADADSEAEGDADSGPSTGSHENTDADYEDGPGQDSQK